jgi:hypothetical protein
MHSGQWATRLLQRCNVFQRTGRLAGFGPALGWYALSTKRYNTVLVSTPPARRYRLFASTILFSACCGGPLAVLAAQAQQAVTLDQISVTRPSQAPRPAPTAPMTSAFGTPRIKVC